LDCASANLRDAAAATAIQPGATLGMILDNLDPFVLEDLFRTDAGDPDYSYGDLTLVDLLAAIPDGYTLGDLLAGLLDTGSIAFEEAPAAGLAPFADGNTVPLRATFVTDGGSGLLTNATISLILPDGFNIRPASLPTLSVPARGLIVTRPVQRGNRVTWPIGELDAGEAAFLDVHVHPGATLCTCPITLELTSDQTGTLTRTVDVSTTENHEDANDKTDTAPVALPDVIYFSHIATAGDVDYWRVPVPAAGAQLSVSLVSPSDTELVMYRPTEATPTARESRAPGLSSLPVTDAGPGAGEQVGTLRAAVLRDVPLLPDRQVTDASTTAGGNESIATTSLGGSGYYHIQVSGYGGTVTNAPYLLRVRILNPVPLTTCRDAARALSAPTTRALPPSIPAGTETLLLVAEGRLRARFRDAATEEILAKLDALAQHVDVNGHPDVNGLVVPIDAASSPIDVAGSYREWDEDPCDVAAANQVVHDINRLVDSLIAATPEETRRDLNLRSLVLVGGDEMIPLFRAPDATILANEFGYGGSLLAEGTDRNTPVAAAAFGRRVLTDDIYGDFDPIEWLDHQLHLPDVAVGRLVEEPAEIVGAIDQFLASDGLLDPSTGSLAAGYDFLNDGTKKVHEWFELQTGEGRSSMLLTDADGTAWTSEDLQGAFVDRSQLAVASVNAHFDHHRALPASGNATGDETDLFTTSRVPAGSRTGTIVFSMGCHSGLTVADNEVGAGTDRAHDWPQAFAEAGAAVYVANTGYGYGDTATVALSERLMSLFAERLDGRFTVGRALMHAKQQYFAELGVYGSHDEKVLIESTFYGLPMYRLGPVTDEPEEPTVETSIDHGLESYLFSHAPVFVERSGPGGTRYLAARPITSPPPPPSPSPPSPTDELTQVTEYQPIQPRVTAAVTAASGTPAHGAVLEKVTVHEDADWPAAFARPVTDLSANQPARPGDGAFPTQFLTVNRVTGSNNRVTASNRRSHRDQLVVVAGQWRSSEGTPGLGTQLRFTDFDARVYYSDSDDWTSPTFGDIDAALDGGVASFSVPVKGETAARVMVLVDRGSSWDPVELTDGDGDGTWTGEVAETDDRIGFLVQAVDGAGNVATSSARGLLHRAATAPPLVDAGADARIVEGEVFSASASFVPTGATSYTATVDWGEGAGPTPAVVVGSAVLLEHEFVTAGTFPVEVTVCDDAGQCGRDTLSVQVDPRPEPRISVGDARGYEGVGKARALRFPLTLSKPSTRPTSVRYTIQTEAGDTATPRADFRARTGVIHIPAGAVSRFVTARIAADTIVEPDETLSIRLVSSDNGVIADGAGRGWIVDAAPSENVLSFGGVSVAEGDEGPRQLIVPVSLTRPLTTDLDVRWKTADGGATAGIDYAPNAGSVRIRRGKTAARIVFTLVPNRVPENDRSFSVGHDLDANAPALPVTVRMGLSTIVDDD
jgi:hypothetical protein